jgi:hypothetical protein
MKQQVSRLSPHQNGKVLAVLMAVSSLVFVVPFMFLTLAFAPQQSRPPVTMFLLMPLFYLAIGYVMVAVGCWFYNLMFPFVGGIEFESSSGEA